MTGRLPLQWNSEQDSGDGSEPRMSTTIRFWAWVDPSRAIPSWERIGLRPPAAVITHFARTVDLPSMSMMSTSAPSRFPGCRILQC